MQRPTSQQSEQRRPPTRKMALEQKAKAVAASIALPELIDSNEPLDASFVVRRMTDALNNDPAVHPEAWGDSIFITSAAVTETLHRAQALLFELNELNIVMSSLAIADKALQAFWGAFKQEEKRLPDMWDGDDSAAHSLERFKQSLEAHQHFVSAQLKRLQLYKSSSDADQFKLLFTNLTKAEQFLTKLVQLTTKVIEQIAEQYYRAYWQVSDPERDYYKTRALNPLVHAMNTTPLPQEARRQVVAYGLGLDGDMFSRAYPDPEFLDEARQRQLVRRMITRGVSDTVEEMAGIAPSVFQRQRNQAAVTHRKRKSRARSFCPRRAKKCVRH